MASRGFVFMSRGGCQGQSYERSSNVVVANQQLTEEEKNKAILFTVFPCHLVSIVAERTFWLSLQPYGTDKVKVFWGVDIFPNSLPEGEKDNAAYAAELKAGFDRINDEDKPIIGSIVQNAKALAAAPGRLSPKERTVWNFQQYLARLLCKPKRNQ